MKRARILLVEDDRDTRWALATILRREGAEVTEAADGGDALGFLARGEFDMVIADVGMPKLGGFGVFSAVRFASGGTSAQRTDLPVMLISGQAARSELARGLEAGVDDFMMKPLDPVEFKARVRSLLRRSRATAAPTARTHGDLSDFGMSALTQALHNSCSSGRLQVRSGTASGFADFQRGEVSHAVFEAPGSDLTGERAALRVLGLTEGVFELLPVPPSAPRTVFDDTQGLLLRAATQADETASQTIQLGPDDMLSTLEVARVRAEAGEAAEAVEPVATGEFAPATTGTLLGTVDAPRAVVSPVTGPPPTTGFASTDAPAAGGVGQSTGEFEDPVYDEDDDTFDPSITFDLGLGPADAAESERRRRALLGDAD